MTPRLISTHQKQYNSVTIFPRMPRTATNRSSWIRKPLWAINNVASSDEDQQLRRHLTLFDLVCVGIGGTIGSGIFVLCGLISHRYAGPATFLSWAIAGVAAFLSGVCFAELAGRIPTSGSSYIYSYVSIGELPAFLAAACLTLEYTVAGSAVARSWGDKVVEYLSLQLHFSDTDLIMRLLNPGWVNPMAFAVSAVSVILLAGGIKESKWATNLMSSVKVLLVVSMTLAGFVLFKKENWTPFIPQQFGVAGIFRGATSSFFGFIGYDEVCCIAGEAINPRENLPKAVLWVIAMVTVLYMTASISLIGMQPYLEISDTSGFPAAFQWNGVSWAAQVCAAGEVLTLPIVVVISLMAQPRLLYALSQDGLLPSFFGRVDATGNLRNGTLVSGISMTFIAAFVPFTYLDDLISAGILVAFTMTNSSLLLLRRSSPEHSPYLLEKLIVVFHVLSFSLALIIRHFAVHWIGKLSSVLISCALISIVVIMASHCKECARFGSNRNDEFDSSFGRQSISVSFFQAPCLPYLPLAGAFVNWYLLAQLEISGMILLFLYFALAVVCYFSYGYSHSIGNTRGWDSGLKDEALKQEFYSVLSSSEADDASDDTFHRVISMPRVCKEYQREIT